MQCAKFLPAGWFALTTRQFAAPLLPYLTVFLCDVDNKSDYRYLHKKLGGKMAGAAPQDLPIFILQTSEGGVLSNGCTVCAATETYTGR